MSHQKEMLIQRVTETKSTTLLKEATFAITSQRSNSVLRRHFLLMVWNGCKAAHVSLLSFLYALASACHEIQHSWKQPSFGWILLRLPTVCLQGEHARTVLQTSPHLLQQDEQRLLCYKAYKVTSVRYGLSPIWGWKEVEWSTVGSFSVALKELQFSEGNFHPYESQTWVCVWQHWV